MWPTGTPKKKFEEFAVLRLQSNDINQGVLQIHKNHQIFVKHALSEEVRKVTLPTFQLKYRLNSDGSTPRLVETIQRLITKGEGNASRAMQNSLDLYYVYNALIEESQRLMKTPDNRVKLPNVMSAAIQKLAEDEIKNNVTNGPFAFMNASFDIAAANSRLMSGEGTRYITPEMMTTADGAGRIGIQHWASPERNFPGQFAQRPQGEYVLRTAPVFGEIYASDYDGDFADILALIRKGQANTPENAPYLGPNKAPALRLMGAMKNIGGHYDEADFLFESKKGVIPTVPWLAGDENKNLLFSQYDQIQKHLDKLRERHDLLRGSRAELLQGSLSQLDLGEDTPLAREVEGLLGGIQSTSPVGLLTTKVYTKEAFEINQILLNRYGEQRLSEMSPERYASLFAREVTRKARSDERFHILEQAALKAAKRGSAADTNLIQAIQNFHLGLQTQRKILIAGKSQFEGNQNRDQFMNVMMDLYNTGDLAELSNLNEEQLRSIIGNRAAAYSTFNSQSLFTVHGSNNEEIRAQPGKLFSAIESFEEIRAAKREVGAVDIRTALERLVDLDVIRVHTINFNEADTIPQLRGLSDQLAAPTMVNILGQEISPRGGMMSENGLLRGGIIRGGLLLDSNPESQNYVPSKKLTANEILTYSMEQVGLDFEMYHSGSNEKFQLGTTEGFFSPNELATKEYNREKLADYMIQKDADIALLHTSKATPRNTRLRLMSDYIQKMAEMSHSDPTGFQRFITQVQLYTPGGSKLWSKISGVLDLDIQLYGSSAPLVLGPDGVTLTLRDMEEARFNQTNRVGVILSHQSDSPEDFAKAGARAAAELDMGFLPHGTPIEGNETTRIIGTGYSGLNFTNQGDFTQTPKRNEVMSSQYKNSAKAKVKVAVFEIDYFQALSDRDGITPEQIGKRLFEDPLEDELAELERRPASGKAKAMGTFAMVTPEGAEKFKQAVYDSESGEIIVPGEPSAEEISQFNMKKKIKVTPRGAEEYYVIPWAEFSNRRTHPKLVDPSGRFKIEPSHISASAKTVGGDVIDLVMGGGEFSGAKSKISDTGLNVFSMLAGTQGWSEEESVERTIKYLADIKTSRDLLEAGQITPGEFIEQITPFKDQLLSEVGAKRELINVDAYTSSGERQTVQTEAYTFEKMIGVATTEAESLQILNESKGTRLNSEYGQRKIAGSVQQIVNVMVEEGQIDPSQVDDTYATLYPALKRELQNEEYHEGYLEATRLAQVAANLGSQLGIEGKVEAPWRRGDLNTSEAVGRRRWEPPAPVGPTPPPTGVQQAEQQASRLGEAASTAARFGGESGSQVAEHLKNMATRNSGGLVAGIAAGIVGMTTLKYTESERDRRRRAKGKLS